MDSKLVKTVVGTSRIEVQSMILAKTQYFIRFLIAALFVVKSTQDLTKFYEKYYEGFRLQKTWVVSDDVVNGFIQYIKLI